MPHRNIPERHLLFEHSIKAFASETPLFESHREQLEKRKSLRIERTYTKQRDLANKRLEWLQAIRPKSELKNIKAGWIYDESGVLGFRKIYGLRELVWE